MLPCATVERRKRILLAYRKHNPLPEGESRSCPAAGFAAAACPRSSVARNAKTKPARPVREEIAYAGCFPDKSAISARFAARRTKTAVSREAEGQAAPKKQGEVVARVDRSALARAWNRYSVQASPPFRSSMLVLRSENAVLHRYTSGARVVVRSAQPSHSSRHAGGQHCSRCSACRSWGCCLCRISVQVAGGKSHKRRSSVRGRHLAGRACSPGVAEKNAYYVQPVQREGKQECRRWRREEGRQEHATACYANGGRRWRRQPPAAARARSESAASRRLPRRRAASAQAVNRI